MVEDCIITIAIPVYNVEKYVEKSLLSALNQDFSLNFEILIIDDKGNDSSMDIVKNVINTHPRGNIIRIVEHPHNKGLGPARNTSIDEARGKYLLFLDSDDWISTDCLTKLYGKAIDTDAEMVVGSVSRVDVNTGSVIRNNVNKDLFIDHPHAGVYMFNNNIDMFIEVWNKLYLLDFLRKYNIGCVHRIMEDYIFDFNMRCNINKIALIPDITLYYNVRPDSIVTKLKGKIGTRESAFTFTDIIKRLQGLITTKYNNIPGILDLYYRRVTWAIEGLLNSTYDKDQQIYIENNIKGYRDFVKKSSDLHDIRNFILHYFDKDTGDLNRFDKIDKITQNKMTRAIFKFINYLK